MYARVMGSPTLDSTLLKQVCSTKYLGVFLDQHLTWQVHVDYSMFLVGLEENFLPLIELRVSPGVLQLLHQVYILPIIFWTTVMLCGCHRILLPLVI